MESPFLIVTGFGDKGISDLANALREHFPGRESTVISGCPWNKALTHPDTLVSEVQRVIRENTRPRDIDSRGGVNLVGHSYGALLALTAACRERMQGISHVILIDGPLNAHVNVAPPEGDSIRRIGFGLFRRQYRHRVRLALECQRALREFSTANIMTIGGSVDHIVPPSSKQIPGVHHETLAPEYRGHGLQTKIPALLEIIGRRICAA